MRIDHRIADRVNLAFARRLRSVRPLLAQIERCASGDFVALLISHKPDRACADGQGLVLGGRHIIIGQRDAIPIGDS